MKRTFFLKILTKIETKYRLKLVDELISSLRGTNGCTQTVL